MATERELKRRIREVEVPFREALRALEARLDAFGRELKAHVVGQPLTHASPPVVNRTLTIIQVTSTPIEEDQRRWRYTGFTKRRGPNHIDTVIDALTRIRYRDDELANRAPIVPGCIGVPRELLAAAEDVNDHKDALAEVVGRLRPDGGRVMVRFTDRDGKVKNRDISAALLHRAGETDVNLKAAYRHIPLVMDPVERIRFMHLRNRTVKSQTVAQLIERVSGFSNSENREKDLAFLAGLDTEEVLSVASRTYERLCTRVRLTKPGGLTSDRRKVGKRSFELPGELPLLYFHLPSTMAQPEVVAPELLTDEDRTKKPRSSSRQKANGKKRGKSVLESTPCLKTIDRCYRRAYDPHKHGESSF